MQTARFATLFNAVTRDTKWRLTEKIDLQFKHFHSQGMLRIGDLFNLSSVEIVERTIMHADPTGKYDRTPGRGVGHLYAFDREGRLVHDLVLGEGDMYHPGGIDYDGQYIWVPLCEYRPLSHSLLYKVDPGDMKAEVVLRIGDSIGGVVRDRDNGTWIGYNWGSRKFYVWNDEGEELSAKDNASHFVDYQDGRYAGDGKMILSGLAHLPGPGGDGNYSLGGLGMIDTRTLSVLHEVPLPLYSTKGVVITNNPVHIEAAGRELRLYAVPDDSSGSVLVYETEGLNIGV